MLLANYWLVITTFNLLQDSLYNSKSGSLSPKPTNKNPLIIHDISFSQMKKISYLTSSLAFGVVLTIIFLFSKPSYGLIKIDITPPLIPNPRLLKAYIALQAWKHAMTSDPNGLTSSWYGPKVCNYTRVFCAPAPDDPYIATVAGIDLNHANIAGCLPEELGLLTDLALFHINSNHFSGKVPESFRKLNLLHELDISNNQFSGEFLMRLNCKCTISYQVIKW